MVCSIRAYEGNHMSLVTGQFSYVIFGELPSLHIRPDGEFVPVRIGEMKPASARKRKDVSDDFAPCRFDLLLESYKVATINDQQRPLRRCRLFRGEAPGEAA